MVALDGRLLEELSRHEALMRALEIMMRDHKRHAGAKGCGTIEIRITYDQGSPVFLEDMGREKHTFKHK